MARYKVKKTCVRDGKRLSIGDIIEVDTQYAKKLSKAGYIHPIAIKEKTKK